MLGVAGKSGNGRRLIGGVAATYLRQSDQQQNAENRTKTSFQTNKKLPPHEHRDGHPRRDERALTVLNPVVPFLTWYESNKSGITLQSYCAFYYAGFFLYKYPVVRGGETEVLEGDWNPKPIVVLQFESMQRATRTKTITSSKAFE